MEFSRQEYWLPFPSPGDRPGPGIKLGSPALQADIFPSEPQGKPKVKVIQSCLTLCDSKDYSPPGSSVHGLLHTGILEWVAIPFSRGFSQSRVPTQVSCIADRFFTIWACYKSWDYLKFQHISKAWVQILFVILSSDPTTLYTLHI